MIKAQQTGLVWFLKSDLTDEQIERLKTLHTYINPKDPENVFSTFIELKDKFGVPYGDLNKVQLTLGETDITDKRIQPKFKTKKKSKLQLRDYQESVLQEIMKFIKDGGNAFNLSGEAGSGKSFLLSNLLAELGTKTLIIAHLSQLTRQLAKEIEEVLGYKPTVLDKDTKELGDINIATSQLISKNPDLWYLIKKGIGCIVIDEAETLASLSTLRIVQRAHAKYHIFISATFTRSVDHRTEALMDFAGNNVFTLKNPALLKPQVIAVHCPEVFNAPLNQNLYNSARGRFYKRETIADKVLKVTQASLKKTRQVLIACDIVELQNTLKDRLEVLGIKAECINSSTKVQRRTDAMLEFNESKLQVLIGFGTLNAGLSIPKISTIIRVATPNSKEKLEQLIGRARRDFDGKDGAFVIDLMFQGFNNESRLSLYKKKRRTDDWKLSQCTWEAFEDKIKGR